MRAFTVAAIVGLGSLPHVLAWGAAGAFSPHSVPGLNTLMLKQKTFEIRKQNQATKLLPRLPSPTSSRRSSRPSALSSPTATRATRRRARRPATFRRWPPGRTRSVFTHVGRLRCTSSTAMATIPRTIAASLVQTAGTGKSAPTSSTRLTTSARS